MAFPFAHICSKWPRHNGASHRTKTEKKEEKQNQQRNMRKEEESEWMRAHTKTEHSIPPEFLIIQTQKEKKELCTKFKCTARWKRIICSFFSFHFISVFFLSAIECVWVRHCNSHYRHQHSSCYSNFLLTKKPAKFYSFLSLAVNVTDKKLRERQRESE